MPAVQINVPTGAAADPPELHVALRKLRVPAGDDAVRTFQRRAGIAASGQLDSATVTAMNSELAHRFWADSKSRIAKVQQLLVRTGAHVDPAELKSRTVGPTTSAALGGRAAVRRARRQAGGRRADGSAGVEVAGRHDPAVAAPRRRRRQARRHDRPDGAEEQDARADQRRRDQGVPDQVRLARHRRARHPDDAADRHGRHQPGQQRREDALGHRRDRAHAGGSQPAAQRDEQARRPRCSRRSPTWARRSTSRSSRRRPSAPPPARR